MLFDVETGNPPYNGTLYHQFMDMSFRTAVGAMIIPAAFLTGTTKADKKLRQQLIDNNVYQIDIQNMGTFKNVQKITAVLYWNSTEPYRGTQLNRGGTSFSYIAADSNPWLVQYNKHSASLLSKLQKIATNPDFYQGRGKQPKHVPYTVAFGEKVAFNQIGWGGDYTRSIIGDCVIVSAEDLVDDAKKRFVTASSLEEATYLHGYLTSDLFTIMGSIVAVEKNFSNNLYQRMPIVTGTGNYNEVELLNKIGATDAEIQWLNTLRSPK